jgi:hypothetical protein
MQPVNSKSLLAFVFGQMEKLDSGQIDVAQASSQANLVKQANNLLKYELDRAKVQMDLSKHNAIYKDSTRLREIESKNFEENTK